MVAWKWGTWARRIATPAKAASLAAAVMFVAASTTYAAASSSDQTIANAINLRATDLPGFTAETSSSSTGSSLSTKARADCPGFTTSGSHTFMSSPNFQRSSSTAVQEVQSQVQIEPSPSAVEVKLRRLQSPKLASCYRRIFDGLTVPASSGGDIKVSDVSVTPLAVNIPKTDGSYGLRVRMVMSIKAIHLQLQMDLVGLGVGHDLLNFFTNNLGQPLPASTESRLELLLVSRALAQPH